MNYYHNHSSRRPRGNSSQCIVLLCCKLLLGLWIAESSSLCQVMGFTPTKARPTVTTTTAFQQRANSFSLTAQQSPLSSSSSPSPSSSLSSSPSLICLSAKRNSNDADSSTTSNNKASIRFSGIYDLDRNANDPKSLVDLFFAGLTSDVTSIALGIGGLLILLVGRLVLDTDLDSNYDTTTAAADSAAAAAAAADSAALSASALADSLGQATRVNLLAVFGCGAILLNGVSKLDVQSAMAERVQLIGINVPSPIVMSSGNKEEEKEEEEADKSGAATPTTKWVLESLLTASPASSVVLLQTSTANDDGVKESASVSSSLSSWQIKGFVGIVPENLLPKDTNNKGTTPTSDDDDDVVMQLPEGATPVLDRLRREDTESYLPTLQALPGRTEFLSYLPVNTQAVLLLPVSPGTSSNSSSPANRTCRRSVIVLGANQARCFTPRDIAWCQVVANRLSGASEA